jgi:hypothetical protein
MCVRERRVYMCADVCADVRAVTCEYSIRSPNFDMTLLYYDTILENLGQFAKVAHCEKTKLLLCGALSYWCMRP